MKKTVITFLSFIQMALFSLADDPVIQIRIDLQSQTGQNRFNVPCHQDESVNVRAYMYLNGVAWQPTTNYGAAMGYGTNRENSTSLIYATNVTINTTNNYIDFSFSRQQVNTNGNFWAEIMVTNVLTGSNWVFGSGTMTIQKSAITSATAAPVLSSGVDYSIITFTGVTNGPLLPGSNVSFRAVGSRGQYYIDTAASAGTTNHNELNNLTYAVSGHTGFQQTIPGTVLTNGSAISALANDVGYLTNAAAFATAAQGIVATNAQARVAVLETNTATLAQGNLAATALQPADTNVLASAIGDLQSAIPVHTNRTDNPHSVTAAQLGAISNGASFSAGTITGNTGEYQADFDNGVLNKLSHPTISGPSLMTGIVDWQNFLCYYLTNTAYGSVQATRIDWGTVPTLYGTWSIDSDATAGKMPVGYDVAASMITAGTSGMVTNNQPSVTFGSVTGDGSNLTNVNAVQLAGLAASLYVTNNANISALANDVGYLTNAAAFATAAQGIVATNAQARVAVLETNVNATAVRYPVVTSNSTVRNILTVAGTLDPDAMGVYYYTNALPEGAGSGTAGYVSATKQNIMGQKYRVWDNGFRWNILIIDGPPGVKTEWWQVSGYPSVEASYDVPSPPYDTTVMGSATAVAGTLTNWTFTTNWISLGTVTANGFEITTNFVPAADNTYDLGTDALRWRDLKLSGNSIYMDGEKVFGVSNGVLTTYVVISNATGNSYTPTGTFESVRINNNAASGKEAVNYNTLTNKIATMAPSLPSGLTFAASNNTFTATNTFSNTNKFLKDVILSGPLVCTNDGRSVHGIIFKVSDINPGAYGAMQRGVKGNTAWTIGTGSYGAMQLGSFSGSVATMGDDCLASIQRGTGSGNFTMNQGCKGAEQTGWNAGTGGNWLMNSGCSGARQAGAGIYGAMTMGANSYGSIQMGRIEGALGQVSTATLTGYGSLQMFGITNAARTATLTGHASLGMGACTVTNDRAIVTGNNQVSHGNESITAGSGGFWSGLRSMVTNNLGWRFNDKVTVDSIGNILIGTNSVVPMYTAEATQSNLILQIYDGRPAWGAQGNGQTNLYIPGIHFGNYQTNLTGVLGALTFFNGARPDTANRMGYIDCVLAGNTNGSNLRFYTASTNTAAIALGMTIGSEGVISGNGYGLTNLNSSWEQYSVYTNDQLIADAGWHDLTLTNIPSNAKTVKGLVTLSASGTGRFLGVGSTSHTGAYVVWAQAIDVKNSCAFDVMVIGGKIGYYIYNSGVNIQEIKVLGGTY